MTRTKRPESLDLVMSRIRAVFGRYRDAELVPATPSCEPDATSMGELRKQLLAKELDSLTAYDLLDYYYLAVEHIGNARDLRHFLPKILQELVFSPEILRPEHLLTLFQSADFANWPEEERCAIICYARAIAAEGILRVNEKEELERIANLSSS